MVTVSLWSIIWRLFIFLFVYVIMIVAVKDEIPTNPFVQIIVYTTISFLWLYITLVYFINKFGSLVLVM
jgi:hypothetical protein